MFRSILLSVVLGLASLGIVGLTPDRAEAQRWGGYYSSYPSYRYYYPGSYYYGYYPGYSYYYPRSYYYPGYSSYYYPGYSSYYYYPGYSSYYYGY